MSSIHTRRGRIVAAALGLGLVAGPLALTSGAVADDSSGSTQRQSTAKAKPHKPTGPVKLDLLAINDFHGQIEKVDGSRSSGGRVGAIHAGGAEYLATHLDRLRAEAAGEGAHTLTVAAGDLIGATPLLSAAFHDEPTIETMNLLGLDISSVGNHEFDEGYRELLRMQEGGCLDDGDGADNQNSCPDGPFAGADFTYLAANVTYEGTKETILPAVSVRKVDGIKVGFIGMTLKDTPNIVTRAGVEGLAFSDEVETANRYAAKLQKRGAEAIVVLLHEGGAPGDQNNVSGCATVAGPGIEIAKRLDPAIDAVVTGHSHQPYICTVQDPNGANRLVTSAFANGRVVTEINLRLDRATGDVIRSTSQARNHIITNDASVAASQVVTDLIARYRALVAPIANEVLGQIAPADSQNTLSRTVEADGLDSLVGNLIADSQKLDPSSIPAGGTPAVIALMNPGGIRGDLRENAAGDVTYGAAFDVQPFNNYVVSMDLTGAQLRAVLNEQWNGKNESTDPTKTNNYKVLQVSGLKYTWDLSEAAATGADAIVGDVMVDLDRNGTAESVLDPNATYRVVVNSFLSDGGDGFPTLATGANKFFGGLDIDSLKKHLAANNPYVPTALDRISNQP